MVHDAARPPLPRQEEVSMSLASPSDSRMTGTREASAERRDSTSKLLEDVSMRSETAGGSPPAARHQSAASPRTQEKCRSRRNLRASIDPRA